MKTKLLVIGVILLMCASALPHTMAHSTAPIVPKRADTIWSDNFDTYQKGQLLDGTSDDGGWKGWDNNPDAFGTVTDEIARSGYSDKITGSSDNVHEYDVEAGTFTYDAWQYIPTNFTGITYFILLSDYWDGGDTECKWAVQVNFDADNQYVMSEFDGVTLPLKTGKWCEIQVEINLTRDFFTFTYDGDILIAKNWTAGPNNQMDGMLKLSAIDLFANGASPVYYDDLSITTTGTPPPPPAKPTLQIDSITAGKGVINAVIKNVGEGNATDVTWNIALTGGFLFKGKSTDGSTPSILAGATANIVSGKILGIGPVKIAITASCAENSTIVSGSAKGFVFLFMVLGVK